jgi:hypothetical protein
MVGVRLLTFALVSHVPAKQYSATRKITQEHLRADYPEVRLSYLTPVSLLHFV